MHQRKQLRMLQLETTKWRHKVSYKGVKFERKDVFTTIVSDTNMTHYFETLINKGLQRCSTIEWE